MIGIISRIAIEAFIAAGHTLPLSYVLLKMFRG